MSDSQIHSVSSPAIAGGEAARTRGLPTDLDIALMELGLIAKMVCSGLHVSKRALNDILAQSVRPKLSNGQPVDIDLSEAGQVTTRAGDLVRTALHAGDQGCILLPIGAAAPLFRARKTRAPVSNPPEVPTRADPDFQAAIETAFSRAPDTMTAAVVVHHRGVRVAERYGSGATPDMAMESWSMGKSLTALLLAAAVQDGLVELDEPIALREWQVDTDDPRRAITFEQALRMSSGLDFSASWAEDYEPARHGYPDHGFIYSGAIDTRALVASRPLLHEPGTFGAYKNGDTLAIMAGLADRLAAQGVDPLRGPYDRLLKPIGANSLLLETDPYGHFLPTGFVFGTARDWAKLAELFMNRGRFAGRQWVDGDVLAACLAPSPGWEGKYWMAAAPEDYADSLYGGQIWLNRHAVQDRWPAPDDMAFFLGTGGQYAFLIPSLDLVIVRMGHIRGTLDTGAGRGHVPALVEAVCKVAEAAQ